MSTRLTLRALGHAALPLAMFTIALAVILLVLSEHVEIIDRVMGGGDRHGDLSQVRTVANQIKGPANVTFGTLVPLGILAGGALMAFGNRRGIQLMGTSAGAGAVVLLGNGVAA